MRQQHGSDIISQNFNRTKDDSFTSVIYFARLEDGTVYERKGSDEEPFEFTVLDGLLFFERL